jgi:hypothetical protein
MEEQIERSFVRSGLLVVVAYFDLTKKKKSQ